MCRERSYVPQFTEKWVTWVSIIVCVIMSYRPDKFYKLHLAKTWIFSWPDQRVQTIASRVGQAATDNHCGLVWTSCGASAPADPLIVEQKWAASRNARKPCHHENHFPLRFECSWMQSSTSSTTCRALGILQFAASRLVLSSTLMDWGGRSVISFCCE